MPMGHQVQFERFESLARYITRDEVRDLIDVLFRGKRDMKFTIIGHIPPGTKVSGEKGGALCGIYVFSPHERIHVISVSVPMTQRVISLGGRLGGNQKGKTTSVRMGIAMVLAHEIMHANQVHEHIQSKWFWAQKKYISRPCEREARGFVDENIEIIARVIGEPVPYGAIKLAAIVEDGPDLKTIAEDLGDCTELTMSDLQEELRSIRANNPKNMERLSSLLRARGILVTS